MFVSLTKCEAKAKTLAARNGALALLNWKSSLGRRVAAKTNQVTVFAGSKLVTSIAMRRLHAPKATAAAARLSEIRNARD
jgi:hypothetical protein